MPAPLLGIPLLAKGAALAGKLIPSLGKLLAIAKTGKVLGPATISAGVQTLAGRNPVDVAKDTALDIALSATGIGVLSKASRLAKPGSMLRKGLMSGAAKDAVTLGTSVLGVPLAAGAIDGSLSLVGLGGGDVQQSPGSLNPGN